MTYDSSTIIANITRAMNEHHNIDTNHHMIIMMHTQVDVLEEYWTQDMKNEKYWMVELIMFVLCFSILDFPIKLMEQGTMHIEAPSGLTFSSITLDFQAWFLHHTAHIEVPPSIII